MTKVCDFQQFGKPVTYPISWPTVPELQSISRTLVHVMRHALVNGTRSAWICSNGLSRSEAHWQLNGSARQARIQDKGGRGCMQSDAVSVRF